jgi:hypothetical protein
LWNPSTYHLEMVVPPKKVEHGQHGKNSRGHSSYDPGGEKD